MRYPNLLFDLDGTLTDPGEGITNSVAYALRQFGIEVTDRRRLYPFIGPPLSESFAEFYGFEGAQITEAIAAYRTYFRDRGIFENKVYPEIPGLLAALRRRGCRLLVATSKPEPFAERILDHFGLRGCFADVCGCTLDERRTKKAEVIAYALEKNGIAPAEALMIGDRRHDAEGAAACGVPCLGALWGYGSRDELTQAGALLLAERPADILRLLEE